MSTGMGDGARTRVRPALRRIAIIFFIILLPAAAHSVWDYIELRRLVREIELIRAKGEPVTERDALGYRPTTDAERKAGSYYLAAAMLALDARPYPVLSHVREWLAGATAPPLPEAAAAPLRKLVEESRDALQLADTAGALASNGFQPGTEHNFRAAGLASVSRLIAARTLSSSVAGQADEAVASAISALQIRRALRSARWMTPSSGDHEVPAILSFSAPSPEPLRRLQLAMEAQEGLDQPIRQLVRERARYLEMLWFRYYGVDPRTPRYYTLRMRSVTETMTRPWLTHQTVAMLREWAELVELARAPWSQKAQARAQISRQLAAETRGRAMGFLDRVRMILTSFRRTPLGFFERAVRPEPLIIDRSSLTAVAIERFRRDHAGALPKTLAELVPQYLATVPADPLTGQPLLFRTDGVAYTIYSVGPNQKDDGGDLTSELKRSIERGWGGRTVRGADVGVRVLIRR